MTLLFEWSMMYAKHDMNKKYNGYNTCIDEIKGGVSFKPFFIISN
jgi:hypothetical protein